MKVRTTLGIVRESCTSALVGFGSESRSHSREAQQQELRVVQINLHHCRAAAAELLLSLTKTEVDIALVQEPYLHKNRVSGLNDGRYSIFSASNGEKVRSCIVAKKSLNLIQLYNYSDGDTTVVRLEVGSGRALVLASVYMPYEEPNPPGILLRKLVEETMSKANLIVGCDANAHHFHWGSSDTNSRATTNWYPVEHTLTRHHITTIKSIDAISIITTLTQPTSHIHQQKSPHTSSHHHTLTAWKVARMVPVPKCSESYDVSNLRPISILPIMSKIVEHIIKDANVEFLDDRICLSSSQNGFRGERSTTMHLLHLTYFRDVFYGSEVGILVGLDLSKLIET
ncbi:uncharacterized protein [Musca autumnalis]|uniref:uncharacterized protein n=1 Tax=Musca autumnalis TaxID=221902 RepID=UPI003CFBAF53